MKRTILVLVVVFYYSLQSFGQGQEYKGKVFVFDFFDQGLECDALGTLVNNNPITMPKGALFTVDRVITDTKLVIKFLDWNPSKVNQVEKVKQYNYSLNAVVSSKKDRKGNKIVIYSKVENSEKFFVIEKAVFDKYCSEYEQTQNWEITLGSLTTPFKFRSDPFLFTTNLNLGTMVVYRYNFKNGFNLGVTGGLSLSSVQLDSMSTKGRITSNSERPAFTPSIGIMFGYKNINLTINRGWDFINKISDIERSWVYHGKPWLGIGLGVSLFKMDGSDNVPSKQKE